jgi:nucleoside-diphosphate-sugar epimerase
VAALVTDPSARSLEGRWQLDPVFVDDAVDALARATVRGTGLLVNVGTGQAVPAKEVQRRVADLCSVKGLLARAFASFNRGDFRSIRLRLTGCLRSNLWQRPKKANRSKCRRATMPDAIG